MARNSGAGETPEDGVAVPAGVTLEDAVPDGEAVSVIDGVFEEDARYDLDAELVIVGEGDLVGHSTSPPTYTAKMG